MMYRGVIFDLDGTLADTELLWKTAKAGVLRAHGYSPNDHWIEVKGGSLPATALALGEMLPGVPAAQWEAELLCLLRARLNDSTVRPMPGARDLVSGLRQAGIAAGVASNSPAELVLEVLKLIGIEVAAAVGIAPPLSPKPRPDVYLEACRQLRLTPAEAMAVEDSDIGVRAARLAGLRVVAVGKGVTEPADRTIPSLTAGLPIFDGVGHGA